MTIYNLGNIKGEKGEKGDSITGATGPVGVGIKSIEQITHKKFKFCLTDGSEYVINYGDEPTFDGISVSSSKDILSYADGDSTVLSAQLTSGGQAVSVSGESVTFEVRKVSDDSLVETLTDTTDNTGLASVEYFGKGVGDLYVKCQCRSVSKRYDIVDAWKYNPFTENTNGWNVPSSVVNSTYNISSTGWKYGNVSSFTRIPQTSDLPEFPYEVSWIITEHNANGFQLEFGNNNGVYVSTAGNQIRLQNGTWRDINLNHTYSVKVYSDRLEFYDENTLVDTYNVVLTSKQCQFATGSNRYCRIKNLIIKPL